MKTLSDLYENMLGDVLHAENQVKKLLGKATPKITDDILSSALDEEATDVATRIAIVDAAFNALGKTPRGVPCEAMQGLVKECEEVVEDAEDDALNAGALAAYQAIKHYEITRFGTLAAWAKRLGDRDMAGKLSAVVSQCKALDKQLSALAEQDLNPAAATDDEGDRSEATSMRAN